MAYYGGSDIIDRPLGSEDQGPPRIASASAPSETKVRVNYTEVEVKYGNPTDPYDVTNPDNYTFTVIGGVSITSDSVALIQSFPPIVEVTINEIMTDGATYTVYVNNVRSKYNVPIDTNANSATFGGSATDPIVESASATAADNVRVQFNKLMTYDSELEKASNYTFSGPTTLDPAISVTAGNAGSKTHADVELSKEMKTGSTYQVEVNNVSDIGENPIAVPPSNQADFTGVGIAPQVNPAAIPMTQTTVRVVFDEQVLNAAAAGNYSILPAISVVSVTGVVDVFTYELTTDPQDTGIPYVITVASAVTDIAGNPIDPAHDEAAFAGMGHSPPEIWMDPDSGADDVQIRTKMRVTARDVEDGHTGINVDTFEMTISYVTAGGSTLIRDVVKAGDFQYAGGVVTGSYQPGFEGKVTGDPMNQETGVIFHFIPKDNWLPDTLYTITATARDNEGTPNVNTLIGTFRTDVPVCFEDDLPSRTALDTTLIDGLAYPNCEQLRKVLMQRCSQSSSQLVRARTLMHLATQTDLRTILAQNFDFALIDDIRLCDRQSALSVHSVVVKYKENILAAIDEVPRLTNATRDFLRQYIRSKSPIYVVNAVAVIVLLAAVLGDN